MNHQSVLLGLLIVVLLAVQAWGWLRALERLLEQAEED